MWSGIWPLISVMCFTPLADENALTPEENQPFIGQVIPLNQAKVKPADAKEVVFVTESGKTYAIAESETSRMLLQDRQMQNRLVRLTGRLQKGTTVLTVERVHTVKAGQLFDVDYWCAHCLLSAKEPGPCRCCGGDTVLRELPAK